MASDLLQRVSVKEVIFIDTGIADWQSLVDGAPEGAEIVTLDPTRDGLAQMAQWAQTHSGYDAIHIISHGSEGQVHLGNFTLDASAIDTRAYELAQLGAALNEKGDLLLYGCEVASGEGQDFIASLAQATQADVAASDDLTGAAGLGGDWVLENTAGSIETATLEALKYSGLLTTVGSSVAIEAGGQQFLGATAVGANVEHYLSGQGLPFDVDPINSTITLEAQWDVGSFDAVFSGGTLDQFTGITRTGGTSAIAELHSATVNNKTITFNVPEGDTGDGTIIFTFTSTAIGGNNAPTLNGAPANITVTEDTASNVDLSDVTFADSDGDSLTAILTASAGTLTAFSSGNVTVSGSGTEALTLSGTAADINSYLDNTSNIQYTGASNASGDNAATLTIKANDGTVDSSTATVNLDITAVNNAPVFVNAGPFSIAENSSNGSVVGDVNANDGDGGANDANVTYSIVSGNPNLDLDGNSAFAIDANTGAITLNDTDDIDYEVATSHTLTISATDQNSATTNQSVIINVTDDEGDNPPMLNTGDMAVLGWNALNDTITFTTLVDLPSGTVLKFTDKGWDQSTDAFTTFSTADGVITWTVGSPITAGSVFELFMGGLDETTTLTNKTTNVDLTADIVSSSFTANDPMIVTGDSVFIYQGGDNNPFFIFGMNNSAGSVDGTNWNTSIALSLRDSMLPDSNGSQNSLTNGTNAIGLPGGASQLDNVQYTGPTSITDKATWLARIANVGNWSGDDTGTVSTSAGSNVQIGGANAAPVFTSSSTASVAENSTAVTTLVATDADGDALSYSLTGGADMGLFSLDKSSGALSFTNAPNFEAPGDSNTDNAYNVEVTASDGQGGNTPLTLTVNVTDTNEAPTLTGKTQASVSENSTGTMYTATGSDPDNNPLTYTLSGTDAALFDLNANSGALSFKSAPDFEMPGDTGGDNVYDVLLTASDGQLSSSAQALAITVTDVNDANNAPVFTSSSKANVAENTTAVTTLAATDADGDTLTYSLTGGADQLLFNLDAKTGALTFISAPDFETPGDSNTDNAYNVEVTASDGQGGDTPLTLTVNVTDTNEAPTLTGKTQASVSENSTGTIYTATGSDPDNNPLTYTLSGTDAALFDLNANSGALSFKSAPDFEMPGDAGGDNVYDVLLTASDGQLSSSAQALAITVTDVNETPPPGPGATPPPPPPPIQVTPPEPQPNTPSGQPSVSEIISNNGATSGNVRLVENTGNNNVVTATLPGRVTLVHEGARTATDRGLALEDLIASINGKTPTNLPDQAGVASQWLASRPEGTLLDIRTLTFSGTAPSSDPIVLTGTGSGNGVVANQEAFVIDVSGLPPGQQIQLDNIDFASIVGSTTILGGAGDNVVIGDDASQYIVLGAGDDELHGGGGDDTIGSEGGDDRLFGDSGNDELFGGAGADQLHGGSDTDTVSYAGNREYYVVTQAHSVITVQSKADPGDIDTLINLESLVFADETLTVSYEDDLAWITGLYAQVLGRQGDVSGVQYWAQQYANGMSRADIALSILNSPESGRLAEEGSDYLDVLYTGLLGRDADASGKAYWSEQAAGGATLRDIVDGFMQSEEMGSHHLRAIEWDFFV